MKLFLLFFLAGCAVRCDDNNYYVIQMPEADEAARARRPLQVYWNVPTMQCTSKKIPFENLSRFGIIQNKNDSFRGEKIAILYDPGIFPALLFNQSTEELRFRNGGVPQEGDLQLHLKMFRIVLSQSIPDINFSGIGIIDFESWRPILRQNFGDVFPYKSISYEIERKKHWLWPPGWVQDEATFRFETAARMFMQNTIALAKKMRPKARWGYYGFPYCFNMASNNAAENCASNVKTENDQLDWLWLESSALYPSVYSSAQLSSAALRQLIRGRVREAARVRRGGLLLPYFWFRYRDGGFFDENDLHIALKTFHQSEADGFIIWGSSNDVNTPAKCRNLLKYIEKVMGPALKRYTKPVDTLNNTIGEFTTERTVTTTERSNPTSEIILLSDLLNVNRENETKNQKTKSKLFNAPKYNTNNAINTHKPTQKVTTSAVRVGNDAFVIFEDYDTTTETFSDKTNISSLIDMLAVTTTVSSGELRHSSYDMPELETTTIIDERNNIADDIIRELERPTIIDNRNNSAGDIIPELERTTIIDERNNSADDIIPELQRTTIIDELNNSDFDIIPELERTTIIDEQNNSAADMLELASNNAYDMLTLASTTTSDELTEDTDNMYELASNTTLDVQSTDDMHKLALTTSLDTPFAITDDFMLETATTISVDELNNSTDDIVLEIPITITPDELNNNTNGVMLETVTTITPDTLNNSTVDIILEIPITITPDELVNGTADTAKYRMNEYLKIMHGQNKSKIEVSAPDIKPNSGNAQYGNFEKNNSKTKIIDFEEYDDPIIHNVDEYVVYNDNDAKEKPNLVLNILIKEMYSGKTATSQDTTLSQINKNSNESMSLLQKPKILSNELLKKINNSENSTITQDNKPFNFIGNPNESMSMSKKPNFISSSLENENKSENSKITQENKPFHLIGHPNGSMSILEFVNIEKTPKIWLTEIEKMINNIEEEERNPPITKPPEHTKSAFTDIPISRVINTEKQSNLMSAESLDKMIENYPTTGAFSGIPTLSDINTEKPSNLTFAEALEKIIENYEPEDGSFDLSEVINDSNGIPELKDIIFNSPFILGSGSASDLFKNNFTFDDKVIEQDNTLRSLTSALEVKNSSQTNLSKDSKKSKPNEDIFDLLKTIDLLHKSVNKEFQKKKASPSTNSIDKRKTQNETAILGKEYNMTILNDTTSFTLPLIKDRFHIRTISNIQQRQMNQTDTFNNTDQQKKPINMTAQDIAKLEDKLGVVKENTKSDKNDYDSAANLGHKGAQVNEYSQDDQPTSNPSSDQVLIVWL